MTISLAVYKSSLLRWLAHEAEQARGVPELLKLAASMPPEERMQTLTGLKAAGSITPEQFDKMSLQDV